MRAPRLLFTKRSVFLFLREFKPYYLWRAVILKNTLRILLVLGLLFGASRPSWAAGQFFFMENEAIGKPAPDFTLPTVGGTATSFAQFRGNDKAIIFFWATWCPHCRRELGNLSQKKEELAGKGIKVALVDIGEDAAQEDADHELDRLDAPEHAARRVDDQRRRDRRHLRVLEG